MSGDIQTRNRIRKLQQKQTSLADSSDPTTPPPVDQRSKSNLLSNVTLGFIAISFSIAVGLLIQEWKSKNWDNSEQNSILLPNFQGLPDNIYAGASSLIEEASSLLSSVSNTLSSYVKPSENEILSESDSLLETQIETPPIYSSSF